MSIASEITDLNTNLQAAKSAVTTKGGTVGDTGLAGLASEIMSIPNGGGSAEPSNGGHITDYNTTTGVIEGDGFGDTAGTVYLLDRDTNTYVAQPTSSWSDTSITLTAPVDTSTIEGHTVIAVVDASGYWTTKYVIAGGIALGSGVAKIYVMNPDTRVVSTITTTTSTIETNLSAPSSNNMAIKKTIEGVEFYTDEIVGFQMDLESPITIYARFLGYLANLSQPVIIRANGTHVGDYFMTGCYSYNQPVEIYSQSSISLGQYFMAYCYSFNQNIKLQDNITSIGQNFLDSCYTFNQPLKLPANATTIYNNFLKDCTDFNENITFPTALQTIGDNFIAAHLSNSGHMAAMEFNKPLNFPNTLTSIGRYFLNQCAGYNQPIVIPEGVTSISDDFLSGVEPNLSNHYVSMGFNAKITLPSTLTSIGNNFLRYCNAFNRPITIPNSVTTIGDYFMGQCSSFNSAISLPSNLTTIEANSFGGWYAFNQEFILPNTLTTINGPICTSWNAFNRNFTLPSSVTTINGSILYYCPSITSFTTETTATPNDPNGNSLAVYQTQSNAKAFVKGITVTGAGTSAWLTALPNLNSTYKRKLIDGTA